MLCKLSVESDNMCVEGEIPFLFEVYIHSEHHNTSYIVYILPDYSSSSLCLCGKLIGEHSSTRPATRTISAELSLIIG